MDKNRSDRLRFAIFGNVYQAKKSASIQKILSYLSEKGAEVAIEREFYTSRPTSSSRWVVTVLC